MGLSKLTDDELERIAYGRFRWEADIIARVGPAGRVAIDPKETSRNLHTFPPICKVKVQAASAASEASTATKRGPC